jgi:cytochrome c-type biogenesis protein CcmH
MIQLYASVAIGTAAALLAAILVLLRVKFQGRRLFVALTRRWVAASTRTSGLVLGVLGVIAVSCFALIRADEESKFNGALDLGVHANAPSEQGTVSGSDESSPTQALESLRAYADKIDANRQSTAATPPAPGSVELPDVNTMIAKLIARLEKQPNDVKGWKQLSNSNLTTLKLRRHWTRQSRRRMQHPELCRLIQKLHQPRTTSKLHRANRILSVTA